ncbi:MAG: acyl-CoA thioester hydrolase [Myxococcota bacterium]|jgi:acyl-CoA thioester hydrolase
MPHIHNVQIYYEDTDFSGVVYHANYLKYFERAREHMLGVDRLVSLFKETGIGFVVYKVEVTFREGAVHGDRLEVRTVAQAASAYRIVFDQSVWRPDGTRAMVEGEVHLACVDGNQKLVPVPVAIIADLKALE